MRLDRIGKSRRPLAYAIAALLVAAAAIGAVELMGEDMAAAHSGLGGKLAPPEIAPAHTPHR